VVDLKLGLPPKQRTVKVSVDLLELLKQELDAYAAEHSKFYSEPVETKALIPRTLEASLRADRGWFSRGKQRRLEQDGQRRTNSTN
jgi:hypothetical protein